MGWAQLNCRKTVHFLAIGEEMLTSDFKICEINFRKGNTLDISG